VPVPGQLDLVSSYGTLHEDRGSDARVGETQEVMNQLRQDFQERDALYERLEQTLHGEIPVKIPEAYDKTATVVRSPMAGHIVNTIVAALSVNDQVIQFQPLGFGNASTENATKREQFLMASWKRQERQAKRRLLRLFMYSLVAKGEGVLKTIERSKTAWGGYRSYASGLRTQLDRDRSLDSDAKDRVYDAKTEEWKRLHAPYPIFTTDVVPESFYYMKGEDGFTVAGEVKDVPYLDTLNRFNMALDARGHVVPAAMGLPLPEWQKVMKGAGQSLKMIELWTAQECQYVLLGPGQKSSQGGSRALAKGTLAKTIKNHGYGDPHTQTLRGPYFQAQGITTASRLPHKAGLGVLYGFLDMLHLLDSMLTISHNNAVMTGFASFKKNRPPQEQALRPRSGQGANPFSEDGDEDDEDSETIEPGFVYPDDIGPLEMPRAGVEFEKFLQMIQRFLELALPSVVQGVVSGDESGYALNQAAHLARLAWDPILDNAEFALSDRVGFESWLIENKIGETVYAWGEVADKRQGRKRMGKMLSLSDEDTRGNHVYIVKLDPQTPSNKSLELKYHIEARAAGYESLADGVEALGGSPDTVERQRLYEEFKERPEVKDRIFQRAMEHLGWKDAQEVEAVQEELALADAAAGEAAGGGDAMASGAGAVIDPAMGNMPETPTPNGSVSGMGPAGRALAGGGGNPPGSPYQPANLPARHNPLPGMG
jgi:hypothetical protein